MKSKADRVTVDLSGYQDLVVILLGMKVNAFTGLKTLFGFGPKINDSVKGAPDDLLGHEYFLFSMFPPHLGMRQYWRDFESLEIWARSDPHRVWWKRFLRNSGGTGFWHEAYFKAGGMEAVYVDVFKDIGFRQFAPVQPARGRMFSARARAQKAGEPKSVAAVNEEEFYS
ncbi:MAG: DUF4188 domain-containing protein [Nitrococcus sp.]|nr:DUF4188 domain-containing protein [Nitrococcus sp.]